MNKLEILGEVFTFVSYLIYWISVFKKEKKNMLLYDNLCKIFTILAFIVLKTYDGIANTVLSIIRNIIGNKIKDKNKKTKIFAFCIILIIMGILYAISFSGISTIFVAICAIFNLYGVIMCNEQGLRICGMLGSIFYFCFMIAAKNYTGAACEAITFISTFLSFIKYRNSYNEEKSM